jgi:hypothetical protein
VDRYLTVKPRRIGDRCSTYQHRRQRQAQHSLGD